MVVRLSLRLAATRGKSGVMLLFMDWLCVLFNLVCVYVSVQFLRCNLVDIIFFDVLVLMFFAPKPYVLVLLMFRVRHLVT